MIRINKPRKAPKVLTTKGKAQTQEDCIAYDIQPSDYHSGSKKFDFDGGPCNSKKRSLFPLKANVDRARNHHTSLESEQPLIINPATDDPREHIHFRGETPVPKTRKGRTTIDILGLRKSDEDRRAELDILKTYRSIVASGKYPLDLLEKARRYLADAVLPKAKYSAMAQDFLNSTVSSSANE